YCWRLYGLKPHFRLCIIDWTVTRFFAGKPEYRRIRLFGWTVYERNREWSGMPVNARWIACGLNFEDRMNKQQNDLIQLLLLEGRITPNEARVLAGLPRTGEA